MGSGDTYEIQKTELGDRVHSKQMCGAYGLMLSNRKECQLLNCTTLNLIQVGVCGGLRGEHEVDLKSSESRIHFRHPGGHSPVKVILLLHHYFDVEHMSFHICVYGT